MTIMGYFGAFCIGVGVGLGIMGAAHETTGTMIAYGAIAGGVAWAVKAGG